MTDGARNALLGYLYQFLVVSSLRVWADAAAEGTSGDSPLRTLLVNSQLTSEKFNQDAVITPDLSPHPVCSLIQVKHSDSGEEIGLQAFTEMLDGFERSRGLATAAGHTVSSYWVVTNRSLHPIVENLWSTKDRSVLTQRLLSARARGKQGRQPLWLQTLVGKYGTPNEAYTAWGEALTRLQPVEVVRPEVTDERLRAYLREHGVLPNDIDDAIRNLLGAFFVDTADGKRVELSRAYLNRHLIGAEDARSAILKSPNGMAAAARTRHVAQLRECGGNTPVRRELLQSLREQAASHPVTVIYGGGGCGKSVLALQYLSDCEAVGVSILSDEATEAFLVRWMNVFRSERNHAELPADDLDKAIQRLSVANQDADIVLVVNIDALDEVRQEGRGLVRDLVRRWLSGIAASSKARLVVSYRPREFGAGAERQILSDVAGLTEEYIRGRVGLVLVPDFSYPELASAALRLHGGAEQRLLRSDQLSAFGGAVVGGDHPVADEIIESLRHPVVWGAYSELQPPHREMVVNSNLAGTRLLAETLVSRFLQKCRARPFVAGLTNHLAEGLRRVAHAAQSSVPPFGVHDVWVAGCVALLGEFVATELYAEALTYGLIVEDERWRWRWRHSFLAPYLLGSRP